MSPLSSNAAARARSLANLQRGGGKPPVAGVHTPNLKHGAYTAIAEATLEAKTLEVFRALTDDDALVLTAADAPMVRLAADALCRVASISSWLAANGWLDGKGQPRESILDLERRFSAQAADHLDALGASPRSRAKLGLDVARGAAASMDLAALWAEQGLDAQGDAIDGTAEDA